MKPKKDATTAHAIVDNMDEEETDNWYEEEKQKSLDDYVKDIELGKNRDESEKKYRAKLQKSILTYNKKMNILLEKKESKKEGFLDKIKGIIARKK